MDTETRKKVAPSAAATELVLFGFAATLLALLASVAQPVAATALLVGAFLLAHVIQQAIATAFFGLRSLVRSDHVPFLLLAVALPLLATPLVIPADARIARMFSAMFAVASITKLWDVHYGTRRGARADLATFLFYLPNYTVLVIRKATLESGSAARLAACLLMGLMAGSAFGWSLHLDWSGIPFIIQHGVKIFAAFTGLLAVAGCIVEATRLRGVAANDFSLGTYLAESPADFWRRYNRPVQQFFQEDVLRAAGGLRAPVRATLVIFALSGLAHEYMFSMAIGRVQGFQLVFFMLQGLAVVATFRVTIPDRWRPAAVAMTFGFNLLTSVLFFASLHNVSPIYSNPPEWLTR